jgi:hypothetical protein
LGAKNGAPSVRAKRLSGFVRVPDRGGILSGVERGLDGLENRPAFRSTFGQDAFCRSNRVTLAAGRVAEAFLPGVTTLVPARLSGRPSLSSVTVADDMILGLAVVGWNVWNQCPDLAIGNRRSTWAADLRALGAFNPSSSFKPIWAMSRSRMVDFGSLMTFS